MPIRGVKLRKRRPIRTDRDRAILLVAILAVFLLGFAAAIVLDLPIRRYDAVLVSTLSLLVSIGVTVVVTTFSFVFVALSLVSVQFSPRVVRHFWHGDPFRRIFLWSSIGIFAFCFAVLFVDSARVHLLAVLLGTYQIFVLFPVFLGYLADNMNAGSITKTIADKTVAEINQIYDFHPDAVEYDTDSRTIRSDRSGFLEKIDTEKLAAVLSDLRGRQPDLKFVTANYIGSFVEVGSGLGVFDRSVEISSEFRSMIARCFVIGKFRSLDQDIEYGIRQLVDIAIKAISPAVNDPTTCVNCIHYLGVIVKELVVRDDGSEVAKASAREGLILKEPSFEQFLDDAFDQIYQFGRRDHVIVRTIVGVLTEVVSVAPDQKRAEIVVREIEEMELAYLFDATRSSPLATIEQRNYLRKALVNFFETASERMKYFENEPRRSELMDGAERHRSSFEGH
ncbi:MAG: DUF2254 family protein [Pyrinomonadaceae bacterium]